MVVLGIEPSNLWMLCKYSTTVPFPSPVLIILEEILEWLYSNVLFSSLCPNFLQMCQWHLTIGLLLQRNEVMSESHAPFHAPPPLERFVSLWCFTFAGFSQMSQTHQCLILFLALRLATAHCQKRLSWGLSMEWALRAQSCCPSGKLSLVISSMEPRSSLTHSSLEVGVSEWLGGGWVSYHK